MRKKILTFDQAADRQDKAVRFLRDVVDDPDRADEIEGLSVQEYAEREGLQLNPSTQPATKAKRKSSMNKQQLTDTINQVLDAREAKKRTNPKRSNPRNPNGASNGGESTAAAGGSVSLDNLASTINQVLDDRDQKMRQNPDGAIDKVEDALNALDENDDDRAYDILVDLYKRFGGEVVED